MRYWVLLTALVVVVGACRSERIDPALLLGEWTTARPNSSGVAGLNVGDSVIQVEHRDGTSLAYAYTAREVSRDSFEVYRIMGEPQGYHWWRIERLDEDSLVVAFRGLPGAAGRTVTTFARVP